MGDEPAVLGVESIHVTIENAPKTKEALETNHNGKSQAEKTSKQQVAISITDRSAPVMRNVELSSEIIHEGFGNLIKIPF